MARKNKDCIYNNSIEFYDQSKN